MNHAYTVVRNLANPDVCQNEKRRGKSVEEEAIKKKMTSAHAHNVFLCLVSTNFVPVSGGECDIKYTNAHLWTWSDLV